MRYHASSDVDTLVNKNDLELIYKNVRICTDNEYPITETKDSVSTLTQHRIRYLPIYRLTIGNLSWPCFKEIISLAEYGV